MQSSVEVAPSEEPIRQPATVEEAAAAMDLSALPLAPGAEDPKMRRVDWLEYQVFLGQGNLKAVFDFQRKALTDRGCQEIAAPTRGISSDTFFRKDGFLISVTVFTADEPGRVLVRLKNHGNVNLAELPVPKSAQRRDSYPTITTFVCDAPPAEAAEEVRQRLLGAGWQPYGIRGDWMRFKKNAVQVEVGVGTRQAEPGKAFINFTSEQLSADLPAPPSAEQISYDDEYKRLRAEAVGTPDDVVAFYKQVLPPAGWQPTTDKRIVDRWNRSKSTMIFGNPAQDRLTLTLRDRENNKTDLDLKHHNAAEAEEADRRSKQDNEEKKH